MKMVAHRFANQAAKEMQVIWDSGNKIVLERRWWLAVIRAQKSLGVPIPDAAIVGYRKAMFTVNFSSIDKRERVTRHDVKARLEEFNALAGGWEHAHKGMTGRDLDDNVELIQIRDSLRQLADRIPVTRSNSAAITRDRLRTVADRVRLRGVWGPVGTGADMVDLLGSADNLFALNRSLAAKFGFGGNSPHLPSLIMDSVGQVYPRSLDYGVATDVLSCLIDLRVGPEWLVMVAGYTRMLAELAGGQWLEGDVSCSVVRRVALPGVFLAASAAIEELNG